MRFGLTLNTPVGIPPRGGSGTGSGENKGDKSAHKSSGESGGNNTRIHPTPDQNPKIFRPAHEEGYEPQYHQRPGRNLNTPANVSLAKNPHLNLRMTGTGTYSPYTMQLATNIDILLNDDAEDHIDLDGSHGHLSHGHGIDLTNEFDQDFDSAESEAAVESGEEKNDSDGAPNKHEDKRSYLANPAVTPTALAHNFWSQVIRPYEDTIIDATAGNGKDSLMLAQMLFPSSTSNTNDKSIATPRLICIDIQQRACENTKSLLEQNFPREIIQDHVEILHTSHAPLPSLPHESVGLICYNLGYLPGADKETFQTQMMTTLYSLADAALLIRPGGLLSVMTYPGNGWKEHCAVNYFMEGMAMFTTRDVGGWRVFVENIPTDAVLEQRHIGLYGGKANTECGADGTVDGISSDPAADSSVKRSDEDSIRQAVMLGLERVKGEGFEKQTWRVFDHRPLGRPLSPILFTGMRIK